MYKCQISGVIDFRYGSIINCKMSGLFVKDEIGGGNFPDSINKIMIVADTIDGELAIRNDNYKFLIANNLFGSTDGYSYIRIRKWNHYSGNTNYFINNEVLSNTTILNIPTINVPYYNIDFSNNVIAPLNISSVQNVSYDSDGSSNSQNGLGQFTSFPSHYTPGFFKWTYNGISPGGSGTPGTNLVFINIPGTNDIVDAGNPAPEYTDIDLTRNDRGRLGGPYSILNYNPTINPSNGKAFIYDLEIPTNLQPTTQPINIKAKAYHRN
ncbi:MAG: hypothetical protein IPI46_04250 [Bacteroidetes bacterium]|nr:hypothetical protein [Bacteroidota bacterium]